MKKSSKNILKEINDFFAEAPTSNQKAWGLIHDFYHLVLTYMEVKNISKADLAKRLNKSRSAISQMFNKTPNITIKKMVEIADAIGIEIRISSPQVLHASAHLVVTSKLAHTFRYIEPPKLDKCKRFIILQKSEDESELGIKNTTVHLKEWYIDKEPYSKLYGIPDHDKSNLEISYH